MDTQSYTIDQKSFSPERLQKALAKSDFTAKKKEEKWYALVRMLPHGLRSALLAELNSGNFVTSLQYANWPQKGSIFVCLGMPFKVDYSKNNFGVKKRELNDPLYWIQDISETVDGIEYLVVC
jgi:hypothetical protein